MKDPLSLNLYTYCKGNPIRYIDSDGHEPIMNNDLFENADPEGFFQDIKEYSDKLNEAYKQAHHSQGDRSLTEIFANSFGDGLDVGILGSALDELPGYISNLFKRAGKAGGQVPPQLLRGQAFEEVVLEELGINKNNSIKLGNSIPDGIGNGRITEVKDVQYIYKDKQFRDYMNSGKPIDLIVSPQSKVSKPLQDAIKNSGGSIRVRQVDGTYIIY